MNGKLHRRVFYISLLMLIFCLIIISDEKIYAAWQGDFNIENNVLIEYRGSNENVVIPDTVSKISDEVFYQNPNISSVVIPHSVVSIGARSFSRCENLQSVEFKVDENGMTKLSTIGVGAFGACKSLSKIFIPNGVKTISEAAFSNCWSLVKLFIPKSVTKIDKSAFEDLNYVTVYYYEGSSSQWSQIQFGFHAVFQQGVGNYDNIPYKIVYNADKSDYVRNTGSGDISASVDTSRGLFWDYEGTKPVDQVVLWMNAKKSTENGKVINKSEAIIYTDVLASYILVSGSGDSTKTSTGRVIAGLTDTEAIPSQSELEQNNGTVKVTVRNGKISLKAKSNPGEYYLHVLDTGDRKNHACCKVIIYASPSKLTVSFPDGTDFKDKRLTMIVGKKYTYRISVNALYDSLKGEAKCDASNISYKLVGHDVTCYDAEWSEQKYDSESNSLINISEKEAHSDGIIVLYATGIMGKDTRSKISFTDAYSMKKASLNLKTINPVSDIFITSTDEDIINDKNAKLFGTNSSNFKISESDKSGKTTKRSEYQLDLYLNYMGDLSDVNNVTSKTWEHEYPTTDKAKIISIPNPDSLNLNSLVKRNNVKFSGYTSTEQRRIKAKINENYKSISITVLSGAPVGTKAWFVLFFNNGIEDYNVQKTSSNAHANMDHVGFQVFSVEITDKTPAASDNG